MGCYKTQVVSITYILKDNRELFATAAISKKVLFSLVKISLYCRTAGIGSIDKFSDNKAAAHVFPKRVPGAIPLPE